MPYYISDTGFVTSGSNAVKSHMRFATVVNQNPAQITQMQWSGAGGNLSAMWGMTAILAKYGTPSTAGSAITPQPVFGTTNVAATTVWAPNVVTSGSVAQVVGGCGFGVAGPGAWSAESPAAGITLFANGGSQGNVDVQTYAGLASSVRAFVSFNEGIS